MKQISIGRVKRDLSEVVNQVAYGGERVVLTSRGRPKAALVSLEDLDRLTAREAGEGREHWARWRVGADRLAENILGRRGGASISVDDLLEPDLRGTQSLRGQGFTEIDPICALQAAMEGLRGEDLGERRRHRRAAQAPGRRGRPVPP